jgi:nucleotide-binding universal stress UspA family protein
MVERMIVGIDGSGPSSAALGWAVKRARGTAARLVLEHVVDDDWGQAGPDWTRELERAGEDLLAQALDRASSVFPDVHLALDIGSPVAVLAGAARNGDLLVIGSHKTGYVRGRILGTRSVAIAALARSSVVVVPEDNLAHRQGVVVGVATGAECHAAIIAGAAEALHQHQELTLIHSSPDRPDAVEAGKRLLAASVELALTVAPGIVVRRRLSHRATADTLLDASRAASLLVLGASRGGTDRAGSIGSVTHDVLLNLTSPVMVAR